MLACKKKFLSLLPHLLTISMIALKLIENFNEENVSHENVYVIGVI